MKRLLLTLLAAGATAAAVSAQAVLMSVDFEDAAWPPAGWTLHDADGDGHGWYRYAGSGEHVTQFGTSTACAFSAMGVPGTSTTFGAQDNWLITPPISVANDKTVFSFNYAAQSTEYPEPMEILVSESDTQPASFTLLASRTAQAEFDYDEYENVITNQKYETSLAAYAGKTIYIAIRHKAQGTYGLSVDNVSLVNNLGPKRVMGISVKAGAEGALETDLGWTAPDQTGSGAALDKVDILIWRDGVLIKELKDTEPGAAGSYKDSPVTAGTHTYQLAARTAEGTSQRSSVFTVQVGPDIPDCVDDVIALASGGKVVLRWKAPTKGANKGFVDPAAFTYTVTRSAEGTQDLTVSGITDTEWTDPSPVTGKPATYVVKAVNAAGTSAADYLASAIAIADADDMGVAASDDFTNQSVSVPFSLSDTYGVSQVIYTPADLSRATGTIKAIILKTRKGNDATIAFPMRVYMHETAATDLSGGWDKTGLTEEAKVYEGTATYSLGTHDVMLTLTKPYDYKGGNLVVTYIKDGKPSGAYLDKFFVADMGGDAIRAYTGSVYDPVDISAMPSFSSWSEKKTTLVPSTRFIMEAHSVGAIAGKVTDAATGSPLAGASVSVAGYADLTALTGADGSYSFAYVPVGTASLTVTKAGYADLTVSATVTDRGRATANAALTQLAHYALSGSITAADTGLPAEGAVVSLSGYEEVSVSAGADGSWTIDPVYAGKDYTLTIAYPLYDVYTAAVNYQTDHQLEPVTLTRARIAPFDVTAAVADDGSAVELTWRDPLDRDCEAGWKSMADMVEPDLFNGDSYGTPDDFNAAHYFSAESIASKKMAGTAVSAVRAYIKAEKGTFTAKVWRGTVAEHTLIGEQVFDASQIKAEGGWAVAEFDTPVELRRGESYLIGIHCLGASDKPLGAIDDGYTTGVNTIKWTEGGYASNIYDAWLIAADCRVPGTSVAVVPNADAPACEYNVYRREAADADWTRITAAPVKDTALTDASWASLLSGSYTYGVTAVYRGAESPRALSMPLERSVDTDAGVTVFVAPVRQAEARDAVEVVVRIANFGEKPVSDIPVAVTLNGGTPVTGTYTGTLTKGQTGDLSLGTIAITEGVHTLRAYTSLEGDQTPANDACELLLPNRANIRLSGYRWNAYGNAGFMSIESNNAEGATFVRELTPGDALISSGTYLNGKVYAYTSTWYGAPRGFAVIDPDIWSVENVMRNDDVYMLDLTYSYPAATMYGLCPDGEDVYLATVDPATGSATLTRKFDRHMMTLAADLDGKLYGVADDGIFYSIDPETAATAAIGPTGIEGKVQYLQSMAFDHTSGRLFWAAEGNIVSGSIHEIDPATGEATRLGDVLLSGIEPSEIVALHTPYTYDGIAGVTAGSGSLTLVMESDGTANITADSAVTIAVFDASGSQIAVATAAAGASRTRLHLPAGLYLVRATDASGRSAVAKAAIR